MWYVKADRGIVSSLVLGCVLLAGCSGGSDGNPASSASVPASAQTIPVLSITTDSGLAITSKDDYVPARYILRDKDGVVVLEGVTEIKGRGNSTWTLPKKPYHMKLATAQVVLGMPANRHWVLLANHADKTLLRNDLAFQLGEWLGMPYTPRSEFVDVQLNGQYEGVYQLTEHIRVAPDRVNITEIKVTDTAPDRVTGGYLLEVDDNRGEPFCFDMQRSPMVICSKNPEALNEPAWQVQRDYIVGYLRQTEEAIFSPTFADPSTGYAKYLDVDSLVNYYLVHELLKNPDGALVSSTYMFKDRGGKLTFGPIWDLDLAAGNAALFGAEIPEGWHIRTAPWYDQLFDDPAFDAKVKAKWAGLKSSGRLDEIMTYIDRRAAFLDKAQAKNFQRWPILNEKVLWNPVAWGSYTAEVDAMKRWLKTRIEWMDTQLSAP